MNWLSRVHCFNKLSIWFSTIGVYLMPPLRINSTVFKMFLCNNYFTVQMEKSSHRESKFKWFIQGDVRTEKSIFPVDSMDYVGKMKLERNQYSFQLFRFNKNTQFQANATFFPRMNTHVHTDTHTHTPPHSLSVALYISIQKASVILMLLRYCF